MPQIFSGPRRVLFGKINRCRFWSEWGFCWCLWLWWLVWSIIAWIGNLNSNPVSKKNLCNSVPRLKLNVRKSRTEKVEIAKVVFQRRIKILIVILKTCKLIHLKWTWNPLRRSRKSQPLLKNAMTRSYTCWIFRCRVLIQRRRQQMISWMLRKLRLGTTIRRWKETR